jgi:hypothetical protein
MNTPDKSSHYSKAEKLPEKTKQVIVEEIIEFLDHVNLPSSIDALVQIEQDLSYLNHQAPENEALDAEDLAERLWTINRYIKLQTTLYWYINKAITPGI